MAINMSKLRADLAGYGINDAKEIFYNPSFETLFEHEMDPHLEGFEKGQLSELGAVNVMTGIFTGRSPKDKYIVMDDTTKDNVWWAHPGNRSDNKPVDDKVWKHCYDLGSRQLTGKKLYVVDGFAGTNADTRMCVRFIMEVAWQAHFVKNMFIRPTED
jgi:phosphoenolpyruvate carboxykinase (ATP)